MHNYYFKIILFLQQIISNDHFISIKQQSRIKNAKMIFKERNLSICR